MRIHEKAENEFMITHFRCLFIKKSIFHDQELHIFFFFFEEFLLWQANKGKLKWPPSMASCYLLGHKAKQQLHYELIMQQWKYNFTQIIATKTRQQHQILTRTHIPIYVTSIDANKMPKILLNYNEWLLLIMIWSLNTVTHINMYIYSTAYTHNLHI